VSIARWNLLGLDLPEWVVCEGAYSRKAYWRMANSGVVKRALTKERLVRWGFYDLATAYQPMHVNC
jgi:RNA-directed DNA polymerase